MSVDRQELQLRLRDVLRPDDGEQRQIIEVVRDGEVLGQLPGVTRAVYEMAINGVSKVTLDVVIQRLEVTTR